MPIKSTIEEEFDDYDRQNSWHFVYERIKNEAALNRDFEYEITDARKPEHRNRNRYRDVSPYNHSRVKLQKGADYINASLVEVPSANRRYILTQGPLPNTAAHLWQMAWEQKTKAVIMLNRVIEKGTIKCCQYWPMGKEQGGEDELVFNEVGLKVIFVREDPASYFTVRTLKLEDLITGESCEVFHFHYTTWSDFGVPQSPVAFLNFLVTVRQSGSLEMDVGPSIVHCSAGIGRSGTLCLVDSCLVLIDRDKDPSAVNVKEMLLSMRKYRMGLIQTPDQLRFSYKAIIEGTRRIMLDGLDSIEAPPPDPVLSRLANSKPDDLEGSSSDEEDNPPPLPPRRARSAPTTPQSPPANDIPMEEKQGSAERQNEIRRRQVSDRRLKTAEIVNSMKKKQQEHEIGRERTSTMSSYLKPVCLGLAVLVAGYSLYRFMITSQD